MCENVFVNKLQAEGCLCHVHKEAFRVLDVHTYLHSVKLVNQSGPFQSQFHLFFVGNKVNYGLLVKALILRMSLSLVHRDLIAAFTEACSVRTRGNCSTLKEGGFRLDMRKRW